MLKNRNNLILAWGWGHLVAELKVGNFESSHALDLVGVNASGFLFGGVWCRYGGAKSLH
jgi:hypothetical protein